MSIRTYTYYHKKNNPILALDKLKKKSFGNSQSPLTSVADITAFCIPFNTLLLLLPTISFTVVSISCDHPPRASMMMLCCFTLQPPWGTPLDWIFTSLQTLFSHCFSHRPLTSQIKILPNSCKERIGFLEHVLVRVNLKIWPRGDLLLSLKSPSGTVSRLTQHRPFDRFKSVSTNLTNWNILTLHHWGEDPRGTWTLKADGDYGW